MGTVEAGAVGNGTARGGAAAMVSAASSPAARAESARAAYSRWWFNRFNIAGRYQFHTVRRTSAESPMLQYLSGAKAPRAEQHPKIRSRDVTVAVQISSARAE